MWSNLFLHFISHHCLVQQTRYIHMRILVVLLWCSCRLLFLPFTEESEVELVLVRFEGKLVWISVVR